jgi:GntR family transcriptional regulator, sialic acid-inducible nan operon repressor
MLGFVPQPNLPRSLRFNPAHSRPARTFPQNEIGMVRIAAQRATEDDIQDLKKALQAQRASLTSPKRLVQTDIGFHRAVVAISGNPIYLAFAQGMSSWIAKFYLDHVQDEGEVDRLCSEYEGIIDCIAARDPDVALKAMTEHLKRPNSLYRRGELDQK